MDVGTSLLIAEYYSGIFCSVTNRQIHQIASVTNRQIDQPRHCPLNHSPEIGFVSRTVKIAVGCHFIGIIFFYFSGEIICKRTKDIILDFTNFYFS